ncbi:MAG: hypothetical protein WA215_03140 [Candidatus Cybelea sp.]
MADHPHHQSPHEHLAKLKERANFQASAHAVMRDYYASWNFWLTLAVLIPTATLLLFPLTTDDFVRAALHMTPNGFKLLNAGVAILAFIAVLVQMVWRPDSRSKAHKRGVDHYSRAKYEVRRLLEEQVPTNAAIERIEEDYLDVQWLPVIEDRRFLRLKQRHLQKIANSKLLDKNPWLRLPLFGGKPKDNGA